MFNLLSPLLVWGTLLGIVPIIIHLLNRRRFKRVEWAPMRYLKMTIRRNKRRIQIEQLLLLLVRVALPVLLFLFLARPVMNPTGLENWFVGTGRTSQLILVDDSLSMGYASGGPPAFHRAREVAEAVIQAAQPQDRCTLIATSAPRTPIFHEVEGGEGREAMARDVLALPQSATHAAWPTVLAGVDEVVQSCTYPTRTLTIITDMRKAGWDAGVGPVARRWAEAGLRVRVVDVGSDEISNVALEALIPLDRTILAAAETHWEALVRNNSPRVLNRAKAILRVDDRPTEVTLPEIPPRQTVKVPLTVRFPVAGMHDLSVQLPEDELSGDNQHWAAVPVKDTLLIRLVDGDPSPDPFGSEVDYLAAPLSVGVGDAEAWRIEVAQEENFLNPRLDPADVIVLANVASPTVEQAQKLLKLVEHGTGLLIFTGSKIDTGLYNDRMGKLAPLLPAALKGQVDEAFHGLVIDPVRPSPIEKLLELRPSALERVPIRQTMAIDETTASPGSTRVLARWNDPGHSAAIIERIVGDGRVLLWTTSADRAGNDWPVEPSFVLAVREAVRGSARPTSFDHTVTAGERPKRIVHSSQQIGNVRVTPPTGGGEPRSLTAVAFEDKTSGDPSPASAIELNDTRQSGLYRLAWEEGMLGPQADLFASNPDPRESGLDRLTGQNLKDLLQPLKVDVAVAKGEGNDTPSTVGREVWHEMAWGLLGLLLLEPILAAWVGRSR